MISYCCKRILTAVPVLLGIGLLAFILGVLSPGDPAEFVLNQDGLYAPSEEQLEAMREELGLNKPLWLRYGLWLMGVLQGDLGRSYITGRDIAAEIAQRIADADLVRERIAAIKSEICDLQDNMICPSCGEKISKNFEFCPICGTRQTKKSQESGGETTKAEDGAAKE